MDVATFFRVSVICFLIQVNQIFALCPEPLFGPNCKDTCYCYSSCSTEGECDTCSDRTFGYKCQYFRNYYNAKSDITQSDIMPTLIDRDDSTCISLNGENIIIDFGKRVTVNWLRFVTSKSDDLQYGFKITFQDDQSKSVNLLRNETLIVVNNTIDVHFQLNSEFIRYIILEGKVVQEMCSLNISAGQRVSFMKTAYYSTPDTNTTRTLNQEALDGYTHSNPLVVGGTLWEIDLESSYIVNAFDIYFKEEAIFRVVIEVYDSNDALIYTRTIGNQGSTNIEFPSSATTPVRYINVTAEDANNANLIFVLEEFLAYGECPEGTWGVQCRENCSSECPDSCRFDDGLCTEVCLGYSDPPKCQTECQSGRFGVNCKSPCSDRCWSYCNSRTGICDQGCLGYSDPPNCTIECDTGTWGVNCSSQCSDRCFNQSCDSITSRCTQGCLGFSDPPDCTTKCDTGLWGRNCGSNCSRCFNSTCNSRTGFCDEGCLGYSDPPTCMTACEPLKWGVNCSNQCSDRCFSQFCDGFNGKCTQGCLGYSDTPECTIECDTGTWGKNCASNCSRCFNSTCDSRTGLCDQGCLGYSDPPSCTTECGSGYWGLNCTNQCSEKCIRKSCDGKSGVCDEDEGLNDESQSLSRAATIAIAVSLSLFGLIVVVVVIVFLKKKGVACFGTTAVVVPQN